MLCVNGLGSDSSGWLGQLPLWSEHYRTIVFDNRDVGRSQYVEDDYDVAALAADALALADVLGLERFHPVGISLGGAIAQEMALTAPERIATLTLIVSFAGAGRWMRERARIEEAALPHTSDEALVDQLMLLTLSEAAYEQSSQIAYLRDLILTYPHRQRRDGFVRQLRASVTHEARDRLALLRCPTHVIGAEHDLLVPVWHARELAALIGGAELTIVEGSGHAVNTERPGELAELVHGFVEERAVVGA
jgi:pimeloyl-ACP methyl ester carboxylesterase